MDISLVDYEMLKNQHYFKHVFPGATDYEYEVGFWKKKQSVIRGYYMMEFGIYFQYQDTYDMVLIFSDDWAASPSVFGLFHFYYGFADEMQSIIFRQLSPDLVIMGTLVETKKINYRSLNVPR